MIHISRSVAAANIQTIHSNLKYSLLFYAWLSIKYTVFSVQINGDQSLLVELVFRLIIGALLCAVVKILTSNYLLH
jgi:hypothetical protein